MSRMAEQTKKESSEKAESQRKLAEQQADADAKAAVTSRPNVSLVRLLINRKILDGTRIVVLLG